MEDRIGQQLGNYRLISLLGQGGFAEVYLGEHVFLKTRAAIKILHTQLADEEMERFLQEARTIASLAHRHIVRVLDFGLEGKTPFLVMEYAPGGTLRQHHPKDSRLSLPTIGSYVKQIASALHYAHEQKLIHRDVKPENMLVGRQGEILLSDFGIALPAQSSRYQRTQDVLGTVAYMAPEQIQGKPRPTSDQYSLAIVVYEWLCGDRPFHGSFTELCAQHVFATPPPLHEKLPMISPGVERVLEIALAKDPKQRFGSLQAFATAFEQASQTVQADPSRVSQTMRPWSQPAVSTVVTPALGQSGQSTLRAPSQLSAAGMTDPSLDPSSQSTFVHTPFSQLSQPTVAFTPPPTTVVSTPSETELLRRDLPFSLGEEDRPVDILTQTVFASKSGVPQEPPERLPPLPAQVFPAPMPGRPRWWLIALSMVLVVIVIGGGSVAVGKPLFTRINPSPTASVPTPAAANPTAPAKLHPTSVAKLHPTSVAKLHPTSVAKLHPTAPPASIPTAPAAPIPTAPAAPTPQPTVVPTPVQTQSPYGTTPNLTMRAFCADLYNGEYQLAYSLFSNHFQNVNSFSSFERSYYQAWCGNNNGFSPAGNEEQTTSQIDYPSGAIYNCTYYLIQDSGGYWEINSSYCVRAQ